MYNFIVSWYEPDSGAYISKTVSLVNEAIIDMALDSLDETPLWGLVHSLIATVDH